MKLYLKIGDKKRDMTMEDVSTRYGLASKIGERFEVDKVYYSIQDVFAEAESQTSTFVVLIIVGAMIGILGGGIGIIIGIMTALFFGGWFKKTEEKAVETFNNS